MDRSPRLPSLKPQLFQVIVPEAERAHLVRAWRLTRIPDAPPSKGDALQRLVAWLRTLGVELGLSTPEDLNLGVVSIRQAIIESDIRHPLIESQQYKMI
jgi:hypothetical protein